MNLYAQVINSAIVQLSWDVLKTTEDWYEIEREPDPLTELLRYDAEADSVLIEKRTKPPEEILAEQKAAEDAALMRADTIRELQTKLADLETRLANIEK